VAKRHKQIKKDLLFKVGGKPIKIVETFKHLGRVTAKNNNDEEAVKQNLGCARETWASMRRFLIQDDVRPKTMAVFHGTVVLCVLLRGSESWVLTKDLMRQLRSFHRRCCQGLARDFVQQDEGGNWICLSSDRFLRKTGVRTIEECIQKRRDAIVEHAMTRNTHEKCKNLGTASKHLLLWEVNCCSDDAAEAP
jgi:hypothetical protein